MHIEKKIWEDKIFPAFEDNLAFHFETPFWSEESDYRISVEIFWKKDPSDHYTPAAIFFSAPCILHHTFKNSIIMKGKLEIKKFSSFTSSDTHGIFGDFYYYKKEGGNYIWHTEGFLISFDPRINPVDPAETVIIIDPVIENIETETSMAANPSVTSNAYSDLFPYIYVSGWPKINAADKSWNFLSYTPLVTSPPTYFFPDKLASSKAANDREAMQQGAISFIEGIPPYEQQFVNNVHALPGNIGTFLPFYNLLVKSGDLDQIVEKTVVFFNTDIAAFLDYLKSSDYLAQKERVWESYFALLIEMGYEIDNLKNTIKVLTLCNFLETIFNNLDSKQSATLLSQKALSQLLYATIVLENAIFPLPPYTILSPPTDSKNAILPYAIGNLQLAQYKLLRYETGELASITSIMPGERRKLVNRKLDRVLDKEITKTVGVTESSATNSEQNNDFNEELWNTIAETVKTVQYPDPGLVSTYGPPTNITVKGSYTTTRTQNEPDQKQLSSFAKKILNRTTQRLSEKINKVRAHTEVKESEDTSVSVLNNENNKDPIYGIYCWLNKVYQAKVVNYGNRMLFSFIVPNPAADYIRQTKTLNGNNAQPPKSLQGLSIHTYQDITAENYLGLCQYYQLKKFPLAPQNTIVVSDIVGQSQSKLIRLPEAYAANSANLEYAFGTGTTEAEVSGFVGQNTFTFSRSAGLVGSQAFQLNNEQNAIAVSAVYNPSIQVSPPEAEIDFQMAVEISCIPLPQTLLAWQIAIYQLLFDAYTEQTALYNFKINAELKRESLNPLSERMIVKQQLEKSIVRQLLENALQVKGLPIDNLNAASAASIGYNQAEIKNYLNAALEWNEMSYTFFDQYDNQEELFAVSSLSPDFFSAFLQAEYARVIIPVSQECNHSFLYFLSTGIIWPVKDSLAPCFQDTDNDGTLNRDPVSIVYELKKTFHNINPKPKTIDKWEVLIPTSMQILQNKKSLNIKNHE